MTERDDMFEARLRRALRDETETLMPSGDGLAKIQDRIETKDRGPAWWRRPAVAVAAAAVLGVLVGGTAVWLRNDNDSNTITPASSGTPSGATTPSSASSPSPSESQASPSVSTAAVPVYFVGGPKSQPRLYREFHRANIEHGPADAALRQMFGAPVDPDYRTAWPTGTKLVSYERNGTVARVEVSAEPTDDIGLQQLVYTVTAAEQDAGLSVQLSVAGTNKGQTLNRADQLDVQAPVWILAPTQDQEVPSPVKVQVIGNTFEGNVVLKVFQGKTEVTSTNVTTAMGMFQQAETTIELPAGSYTLRAYDEGGAEGGLREQDSKDFTVSP
jgi:hypothetical protein